MRTGPPPRTQQYTSIAMMVLMLIVIVVMRKHCADGTANLFKAMDAPATHSPGDAGR